MRHKIVTGLLLSLCVASAEDRRIGSIDFFGYSDFDLAILRETFPLRIGSEVVSEEKALDALSADFAKRIGRDRVELAFSCCMADGSYSLFVGVATPSSEAIFPSVPRNRSLRLSRQALNWYGEFFEKLEKALSAGHAEEVWQPEGFSLFSDPAVRKLQLQVRNYVQSHLAEVISTAKFAYDDHHRAAAVWVLSHAHHSDAKLQGLLAASLDSSFTVRDNAIRALIVNLRNVPGIAQQIPLRTYIPMLHSFAFNDRNRAASILALQTVGRDPALLEILRKDALVELREMALWQERSHAFDSFAILGRIAGLEEPRIAELFASNDPQPILRILFP